MTFQVHVEKLKLLDLLESIRVLADEATFDVSKEAWRFRGMDPSHICLIDINHPLNMFQEADIDENIRFGIRLDPTISVVKRFDDKDVVTLTEKDSLFVIKTKDKEFKLRMKDPEASDRPLPKVTYDCKLATTWSTIDMAVKDIKSVSEFLTVECKNGRASFYGRGDNGEATIKLTEGWECKGDGKATYSLDYIAKAVAAVKHAEGVKLEYSDKKPLKLSFDGRYIAYYLAPRVQD